MASKRKNPAAGEPEPAGEAGPPDAVAPAPAPSAAPADAPVPGETAPSASQSAVSSAEAQDASRELEQALAATFPDLVIVDGDLELSDDLTVDLACVDSGGRALFVRTLTGEGDAPVLLAIDLVRGIRENHEVLVRHLDHPALRADLPPLAVLIADRFSDTVLARLACIEEGAVWCLERRSIRSRAGTSTHLVPVLPLEPPGADSQEEPTEFCRHLAPEHRDLGLTLVGRLQRIDEELEYLPVDRGVRWTLGGQQVCGLLARDGRLQGSIAPRSTVIGIDSSELLERFVEDALGRTVDLLGAATGEVGDSDPMREAAFDPDQPILTAEEIQAFHDL